jgi:hypothetical protein
VVWRDETAVSDYIIYYKKFSILKIWRLLLHVMVTGFTSNSEGMVPTCWISGGVYITSLETFIEICHKLLSRKYDKDHEIIQAIVRYVWEHTRDVREAVAIAKIVDT